MNKMKDKVKVYKLIDLDENGYRLAMGTIEEIRIFMKNRWLIDGTGEYINDILDTDFIEEEYYCFIDDDGNLLDVIESLNYMLIEECEVPIEDFF